MREKTADAGIDQLCRWFTEKRAGDDPGRAIEKDLKA
jgi:hypothetical protein